MSPIPSGKERARPFLAARDHDLSKNFDEALGFRKLLDSELAIFAAGSSGFILERHDQQGWTGNCMMQLMVDELNAWWSPIVGLDWAGKFGVEPPRAPAMQTWGLRVAYVFDPSGILWHVRERRVGKIQD